MAETAGWQPRFAQLLREIRFTGGADIGFAEPYQILGREAAAAAGAGERSLVGRGLDRARQRVIGLPFGHSGMPYQGVGADDTGADADFDGHFMAIGAARDQVDIARRSGVGSSIALW